MRVSDPCTNNTSNLSKTNYHFNSLGKGLTMEIMYLQAGIWSTEVWPEENEYQGTWVAQLVKCPNSAQAMISWFVDLSPATGSMLTAQNLEPASDSVSPSLSAWLLLMLCLSLFLFLSLSLSRIVNIKNLF